MTIKNVLRLFSILLLGQFIPAFAGLDDHRHLPRDGPKTREQFKQSLSLAEKGDAYAQYLVCAGYYAGKVIKKNYSKALSWCTLSAQQGLKQAQYWLGYFYFDTLVVERDYEKAVHWFQLSAQQGYDDAQYYLALMYQGGRGIGKNHERAVYWYQLAAKQGHRRANEALNRYRIFEEELARAQQGDTRVHWRLAGECLVGDIAHPACAQTPIWCETAANEGSGVYQSYLGQLYLRGQVYKHGYKGEKDYAKALYWLQLSASKKPHDLSSNYLLGTMYEDGLGVTKSQEKAIYYYQLSAKRGGHQAKDALKRINRFKYWLWILQSKPISPMP